MTIIRKSSGQQASLQRAPLKRASLKQRSLDRILDAAAKRLREEGLKGAAIVPVMRDAGLTHGTFYSHFSNKDELATAAFAQAIASGQSRWFGREIDVSWGARLKRLAKRYLTKPHCDERADGCAFAALSADSARASPEFKAAYARELRETLMRICEPFEDGDVNAEHFDQAIALMALCVGGLSLARAVDDETFAKRILRACNKATAAAADVLDSKFNAPRGKSK